METAGFTSSQRLNATGTDRSKRGCGCVNPVASQIAISAAARVQPRQQPSLGPPRSRWCCNFPGRELNVQLVARRTVAKYRDIIGAPVARLRKKL